jgi:Tol biopolymer transport system component
VIRLSLTAPTAKFFDMKFISWLKMVITHEYTHIAHFEMTAGPTTALRALFGQILTPNALQPIWSIEGLAVYNETKFTAGGRGIDTRYDMYLRMAALEDQFNALDQINGYYLTSWPSGTAPYIYGQSIIHFIAQKYGEDEVIAISEIFCEYPYLGFNYAIKKTIGLNLEELYQTWKDYLKEKYQFQAQKIFSKKKLTSSQQLTKYNYWVDYPCWISTPDGDKIVFRVSTPHSYPFIQIINPLSPSLPLTPRSIKNESLIERTYGRDSFFSISPDSSKIIYAKLDDYEQFYKFYDIYLFDLKTEKETRLSEGLRARDPSWSPDLDNPQIVAVINQSGTNNLALINLHSTGLSINENQPANKSITKEDIVYLTDFQDGTQLSQPSWSPKGDKIALSAWRQGYQDIYILNLDSNNIDNSTLQPIFCDKSIDLSPCWSPDGQYLFFASDRTGIYNIFAFSLSDKKLYQITNVLSGAFQPAISPDGTQSTRHLPRWHPASLYRISRHRI